MEAIYSTSGALLLAAGASTTNKNLRYAALPHAKLTGVNFTGSDLSFCDLTRADCTNTIFTNTTIAGGILYATKLSGSVFNNCEAPGADFRYSVISGVTSIGMFAPSSDFRWVTVTGSNFTNGNYRNSVFTNANLSLTSIIDNVNFRGCDFRLTDVQIGLGMYTIPPDYTGAFFS